MPSIFPELAAGGLVIRTQAGAPTGAVVERAYVPPAAFAANCDLTALPSDCTARFEPKQLNAIVSELVSFAECMDPNGPWDCSSLQNLCAAFNAWKATVLQSGVIIADTPPTAQYSGQLWWESDTGALYIWYDDGNSQQWVQVSGTGAKAVMDGISIVGQGTAADPHRVGLVDCGAY